MEVWNPKNLTNHEPPLHPPKWNVYFKCIGFLGNVKENIFDEVLSRAHYDSKRPLEVYIYIYIWGIVGSGDIRSLMMRTKMVLETSVLYTLRTRLIARENILSSPCRRESLRYEEICVVILNTASIHITAQPVALIGCHLDNRMYPVMSTFSY
jgi:hypothetical protein